MRFAKSILVAVLGLAFAAYGFDCSPMMSPDKAMECCDSMNCSQGMHSENCCQTAPSIHAPFVQPAPMQSIAFAPLALALPAVASRRLDIVHADGPDGLRFHDPPLIFDSISPLPLRI